MSHFIVSRQTSNPYTMMGCYLPRVDHATHAQATMEKLRLEDKFRGVKFMILTVEANETIQQRMQSWVDYSVREHPELFDKKYAEQWKHKAQLLPDAKVHTTVKLGTPYKEKYVVSGNLYAPNTTQFTQSSNQPWSIKMDGKYNHCKRHGVMHSLNTECSMCKAESSANICVEIAQEKAMTIKVTNPVFVNGREQSSYTVDDLIHLITSAEKEVHVLGTMQAESKTVKALVAKKQSGIADLVKVLDARKLDD